MSSGFAFLDHPRPLAFAHRGGVAHGLENTMTAFTNAVAMGYRYLETDAHATADGVALAFHDHRLDRVTDRTGTIAELPYREVAAARVGGAEPIPLLADLLGAWPDVRVNIDVKQAAAIGPVVEVIRRTGAADRVCVAAFSDRRLGAVRARLGPGLATSLGPREVLRLRAAAHRRLRPGRTYPPPPAPCAQVPERIGALRVVDRRFVAAAHARGIQVHVWTVNDRPGMERLLDLGVDGLMTDRLALLKEVLVARGQWREGA
jgi:glycerophosphoryl diester phosphodiesterase